MIEDEVAVPQSTNNKERICILEEKLDRHIMDYQERQIRQDVAHAQNMEAIAELTKATQGVVDAWGAAISFQKFIKWVSTFGLLVVVGNWLSSLPLIRVLFTKGG